MRKAERFQPGETLARDIGPKLNLLVDRSNREIRGDGRSIAVNECGNTITISQLGPKGAGGGGGGGGGPTAMFVPSIDTTTNKISITGGTASVASRMVTIADDYFTGIAVSNGVLCIKFIVAITTPYAVTYETNIATYSDGIIMPTDMHTGLLPIATIASGDFSVKWEHYSIPFVPVYSISDELVVP